MPLLRPIDKDREKALKQWQKVVWLGYGLVLLGAAVPIISYSLRASDYRFNHAFSISSLLIFSGVVLWVYGRKRVLMLESASNQPGSVSIDGENNHTHTGMPAPPPPNTSHLPAYSSAAPLNGCPYPPSMYYPEHANNRHVSDIPPPYSTIFAPPPLQSNNESWIQPPPSTPSTCPSSANPQSTPRQPHPLQDHLHVPHVNPPEFASDPLQPTPVPQETEHSQVVTTSRQAVSTQHDTIADVLAQTEVGALAPNNGNAIAEGPGVSVRSPTYTGGEGR